MKFTVKEQINRGGFGVVERVILDDGRQAARKVYKPAFPITSVDDDAKLRKRFNREVKVQSSLDPARVVPILGFDLECQEPWFLMPLADKNLCDEIQTARASGVPPQKALADILNALEDIHALGYVHRDLKPQNVLHIDGIWRLADFGLVLPPTGSTTRLTSLDSNWGSMGYAAPEQALEFRSVGPGADIYAFGCILHDIFGTGPRLPYQRYSAPGPVGAIIEKCTEIKPEKRFKTIQALRGALLTLIAAATTASISQTATEWIDALPSAESWDKDRFEGFLRFLVHQPDPQDRFAVFKASDEVVLQSLSDLDNELFKFLLLAYCDWAESSSFSFEYCDVLIRRLQLLFLLGDIESQAAVALAAAELGASHNRWFVMDHVIDMCGPALDESVAHRIAIEITAQGREESFRRCIEEMKRRYADYHPRIREAVENGTGF